MIPKGVIDAVKKFREENKTPPPSATLTTKARGQSNPTLDAIKDAGMRALQGVSTTLDAIPPSVDLYPGPVDNVAVMGLAGLNKGIKTLVKGERGMDEVVGAVNAVRALKPLTKIDDVASKIKDATKLSINKLIALNSEGFDDAISNIAKGQPSVTKGPIDVLKTGEGYLIVDGNHRVVQSMQKGLKDIDANILSKEQAIAKHPEYEIAIESALDASPSTAKLPTQPTYYRATTDGQTLGSGQKWAWTDKASAESWAKRNNAKVVEFTVPDSAIDPIDLSRMKQGTTDRFMFDTSKANTLPKLPIQTGEITVYRGGRDMGDSRMLTPAKQNSGALFFTESEKYAKQYSRTPDQVSGLYKTNIKTDKIFDITNPSHIKQLEKHIQPEALQSIKDSTSHGAIDWATGSQYVDEIEKAGFKGAKFLERPAENITPQLDGSFKLSGKPVYSYALFDKQVPMTRASLPTQTGERVYHGTNYDKFDPTKAVSRDGQYGKGIYFASDKAVAKQYGKNTIEAVLDKDSLLKMDKPLTPQQQANLRKVMGRDEWDWSKNPTGDFVWGRLELSHKNPEEILKKAGIKGVEHSQYTTKGANKNYVIFDDSAVKPSLPTQVEGLAKEVQLSDKPYNFKYTSDEMPTTGKTITYQGKEVGGIGYGKDLNQKDAWLHNIEIDPQYRNKGIGKKAIDQFFQTSGANKVNGYAESPEAAKFFKSLGAKVDTDGNFTLSKTDFFNQSKGVQTVDIKKLEIPDFNNGVEVNGWDDIYRKSDAKTRDKMDKDINYLLKDKNNELAPIKINEDGGFVDVVDGHHRVASYRYAGREKIPFTTVNSKGVQNEGVIGAIKAVEAIRKIPQK